MRVVKDTERMTGSYALKFRLEREIEKTEQDKAGTERFLPEVADSIIAELRKRLGEVEKNIQAKWDQVGRAGKQVAIQAAFGFYWDCDIDEEEIPF